MKTNNASKSVQPGKTFIAYINDDTCCVGVVSGQDENDDRKWKTLVLGYFKDGGRMYKTNTDVFDRPFPYVFPGYKSIMEKDIIPYDFDAEITLCKSRNGTWWKSLGAPCYTNLVAKHFRPQQLQVLQYIDIAIQILQGKDIDTCKTIGHWDEELFLRLWSVLYSHFPTQVVKPPQEYDASNSNIFYLIDLESDPPKITSDLRPPGYIKKRS